MKRFLLVFVGALVVASGLYLAFVLHWVYSSGERAGWVQKLSLKGWVCKTWEGELAMVPTPGATPEKFYFTVKSDAVAERINKAMGGRVALHYEQHKGVPSSCFGESEYWVDAIIPEAPALAPSPAPAPTAPAN